MNRLPVIPAITHMWQSTVNNMWFALRSQWPWFVVVAVLGTVLFWLGGFPMSQSGTDVTNKIEDLPPGQIGQFLFAFFVSIVVALLAFSSVAVSWHRYVLLDEVPMGLQKLRVDRTVWRYLGNLILIGLMASVVMIPAVVLFGILSSISGVLGLGFMLAYSMIVMMPVIYRLSIKLPAIALGRKDFGFGDGWHFSRENWWQIVGVAVVISAISWIISFVVVLASSVLVNLLGPTIGTGIVMVAQVIVNWLFTVMGITLLTSLYGFFVEKRSF